MPPLLVVGLGNPGRGYDGTYHNAGREVVAAFAKKRRLSFREGSNAWIASFDRGLLVLPNTYMNLSGQAVGPLARRKGIPPEQVIVVVDDTYIPAGTVRIRPSGSCAGHNGLISVEEALGSPDYPRIRVGAGPDPGGEYRADYVLSRPRPETLADFVKGKELALEALDTLIESGIKEAMNTFNAG